MKRELTEEEIHALQTFAGRIVSEAERLGLQTPALKASFDEYSFASGRRSGQPFIRANPEVTLGVIKSGISPNGVIRHEFRHLQGRNLEVYGIESNIAYIEADLDFIHKALVRNPRQAVADIVTGISDQDKLSVAHSSEAWDIFKKTLHEVEEAILAPLTSFASRYPDIYQAPPNAIAHKMETGEEHYLEFERELLRSEPVAALGKCRHILAKVTDRMSQHTVAHPIMEGNHIRQQDVINTVEKLHRVRILAHRSSPQDVLEHLLQGGELAMDSYSAANGVNAEDKSSLVAFLRNFATRSAEGGKASALDAPIVHEHPKTGNRIARLEFFCAKGQTPESYAEQIAAQKRNGIVQRYP